jgi:hypothetical protein
MVILAYWFGQLCSGLLSFVGGNISSGLLTVVGESLNGKLLFKSGGFTLLPLLLVKATSYF